MNPWTRAALVAWVLVILAVTVLPRWWAEAADAAARPTPTSEDYYDVVGNIALFVPLGAGLALLRLPWRRAVALGAALSVAIELVQLLPALDRASQWHDVAANTGGAALGFAVTHRFLDRRGTEPAHDLRTRP